MILKGIKGLLESKKGTLSLIILGLATWALMTRHLEGMSYAAIISTIAIIYNFVQHRIDMLDQNAQWSNPAIGTPDAPIEGRNP